MATNASDPAALQYARALFEVAQARNEVGTVFDELSALNTAYEQDLGFREFFTSPKISPERKHEIFTSSLGAKFTETVSNFVGVLMKKRRETLLDNICDAFGTYRDNAENRVHVWIESANELNEQVKLDLTSKLAASLGKEVSLHVRVEPTLLGGMRLRCGDRVIDNSLRTRVADLSHHLLGHGSQLVTFASAEEVENLYNIGKEKAEASA
ncbi:MAG: ATP synthase F1 subunit delta [Planctomycetes bacterium]|nr:ATP synthase F1 subunit delta [Planctomycetota bacterium]